MPRIAPLAPVLSLLIGAVAVAQPAEWTVNELLAGFREMPGLEARFREEKTISLLAAPLISEGTLYFAPPARLARRISRPTPSVLRICDGILSFGDGSELEEIDLKESPVLREYVNSFLRILEGDAETLVELWEMELTGDAEGWRLRLRPLSESIARTIEEMRLKGRGALVERLQVVESTGDESITTYSEIQTERHFSDEELESIFCDPAASE